MMLMAFRCGEWMEGAQISARYVEQNHMAARKFGLGQAPMHQQQEVSRSRGQGESATPLAADMRG